MLRRSSSSILFFFNDTATTEIYTLSLHDALPICRGGSRWLDGPRISVSSFCVSAEGAASSRSKFRSEEHTSELQSHLNLVCRLLLEKKKTNTVLSSDNQAVAR